MLTLSGNETPLEVLTEFEFIDLESSSFEIDSGEGELERSVEFKTPLDESDEAVQRDLSFTTDSAVKITLKAPSGITIDITEAKVLYREVSAVDSAEELDLTKRDLATAISDFASSVGGDLQEGAIHFHSDIYGDDAWCSIVETAKEQSIPTSIEGTEVENLTEWTAKITLSDILSGAQSDVVVTDKIVITFSATLESGEVVEKEKEFSAYFTSIGKSSNSNILSFGDNVPTLSGWWDDASFPYTLQTYTAAATTKEALAKSYLLSKYAPVACNGEFYNLFFFAKSRGEYFGITTAIHSRLSIPLTSELSISQQADGLTGEITMEIADGKVTLNSSSVDSKSGYAQIQFECAQAENKNVFVIETGLKNSDDLLCAASSAEQCYNSIDTSDSKLAASGDACDADLYSFMSYIDGTIVLMSNFGFVNIIPTIVFGFLTRGLSCASTTTALSFVTALVNFNSKLPLSDSMGRTNLKGIGNVLASYSNSMVYAQNKLGGRGASKVAKQWLDSISGETMRRRNGVGTFTLFFPYIVFCVPIPVPFNLGNNNYTGRPMHGVSLREDIVLSAETDDQLMTDSAEAMLKKQVQMRIYKSELSTRMNYRAGDWVRTKTARWAWSGTMLILKKNGRHNEFYSSQQETYRLASIENIEPTVNNEISEQWTILEKEIYKWDSLWDDFHGFDAMPAEVAQERLEKRDLMVLPMFYAEHEVKILDVDNGLLIDPTERTETRVDFVSPTDNVLLAYKTEEE